MQSLVAPPELSVPCMQAYIQVDEKGYTKAFENFGVPELSYNEVEKGDKCTILYAHQEALVAEPLKLGVCIERDGQERPVLIGTATRMGTQQPAAPFVAGITVEQFSVLLEGLAKSFRPSSGSNARSSAGRGGGASASAAAAAGGACASAAYDKVIVYMMSGGEWIKDLRPDAPRSRAPHFHVKAPMAAQDYLRRYRLDGNLKIGTNKDCRREEVYERRLGVELQWASPAELSNSMKEAPEVDWEAGTRGAEAPAGATAAAPATAGTPEKNKWFALPAGYQLFDNVTLVGCRNSPVVGLYRIKDDGERCAPLSTHLLQ